MREVTKGISQSCENSRFLKNTLLWERKTGRKTSCKRYKDLLFILTFATREHRMFEAFLKLLNKHDFSYACIKFVHHEETLTVGGQWVTKAKPRS